MACKSRTASLAAPAAACRAGPLLARAEGASRAQLLSLWCLPSCLALCVAVGLCAHHASSCPRGRHSSQGGEVLFFSPRYDPLPFLHPACRHCTAWANGLIAVTSRQRGTPPARCRLSRKPLFWSSAGGLHHGTVLSCAPLLSAPRVPALLLRPSAPFLLLPAAARPARRPAMARQLLLPAALLLLLLAPARAGPAPAARELTSCDALELARPVTRSVARGSSVLVRSCSGFRGGTFSARVLNPTGAYVGVYLGVGTSQCSTPCVRWCEEPPSAPSFPLFCCDLTQLEPTRPAFPSLCHIPHPTQV